MKKNKKKSTAFSKILLIQESALIWVMTLFFMFLAYECIKQQYFGELPWLAAMIGFPWTAYGASQAFYYHKSTKENTKNGVVFETAVAETKVNLGLITEDDTPVG